MAELTKRLDDMTSAKHDKDETLMTTQKELKELRDEFETKTNSLTNVTNELQEKKDRLLAIEEDAGLEFRSKIRLLERKLADADSKVDDDMWIMGFWCGGTMVGCLFVGG